MYLLYWVTNSTFQIMLLFQVLQVVRTEFR
jgi:hypothetical protein